MEALQQLADQVTDVEKKNPDIILGLLLRSLKCKFSASDPASVWRCLQDMTNYRNYTPILYQTNN